MQNLTITQNDKGYLISIPITDSAGVAKNLTNYTVKLKAWLLGTVELVIDGACTKVEPQTSGIVTYELAAIDTAVGARYIAKCEMTMTDVIESTQAFTIVIPSQILYCTLSEVKAELDIEGEDKDDYLYGMVEQVKGLIDSYCQRSFNTVVETKYYDGVDETLFIDDLVSIGGGSVTNDTGIATGSPIALTHGQHTITVTQVGKLTVVLPTGSTGSAVSGTCTVTGSPVSLVGGGQSITTTTATGTITITVNDGVWLDDGGRTYDTELTASDYDLFPYNRTPHTIMMVSPAGSIYDLADGIKKGVKIIGTWGYQSTIPDAIRRAAIMWVTIIEMGRKAGYSNVIGSTETGVITIDRDPPSQVKKILEAYRKKRLF